MHGKFVRPYFYWSSSRKLSQSDTAGTHSLEDERTLIFQYADDFIFLSFDNLFDPAVDNLNNIII